MLIIVLILNAINWFKTEIAKHFNIKNLRETKKILGIKVTYNRKQRIIKLNQTQYFKDILLYFGINTLRYRLVLILINGYNSLILATNTDK